MGPERCNVLGWGERLCRIGRGGRGLGAAGRGGDERGEGGVEDEKAGGESAILKLFLL